MKTYPVVDLTGNTYLNPVGAAYGDGTGTHQRNVGQIASISIHHDDTPRPHDYDSVARYTQEAKGHYERLGPGLQYHFKIDNTGTIFKIRPLTTWLYVVGSAENVTTIAICLDGVFQTGTSLPAQEPTREQYEALGQLLIDLCENHPEFPATYPDVRAHEDYSPTACCGDNLVPWVVAIESKDDVLNIPESAVYDWPSEQPGYVTQSPTPPSVEATPPAIPAIVVPPTPALEETSHSVSVEAPADEAAPEPSEPVTIPITVTPVRANFWDVVKSFIRDLIGK